MTLLLSQRKRTRSGSLKIFRHVRDTIIGDISAKLVGQNSKGMPLVSISLSKLMGSDVGGVMTIGKLITKNIQSLQGYTNVLCKRFQLSVIANLVGARASAEGIGWREATLFLLAVGMGHYLVLFVTLYQRHPGGEGLPVNLRPVFFLFVARPSMASLAWSSVNGSFDSAAKMLFFLSLFLLFDKQTKVVQEINEKVQRSMVGIRWL